MKPSTKALVAAGALGAALAAVVIPLTANADKTVTYLTANAAWVRLEFLPVSDGSVDALICGRTADSLGNLTQPTCYKRNFASGSAQATTVNGFGNGAGLTFWKTQEGL